MDNTGSSRIVVTATKGLHVSAPRLHTITAACQQLSIGRSSLYLLIESGELKSVKVGGRRLISDKAIAEFIANLEAASGSAA